MPPQNREFGVFGKSIFEAGGEPIGHRVADDHYRVRSRGVGLLLRARSVGVIRRFLPLPRHRSWRRTEQIAEQVKRSRCALLWLRSSRISPISPSAPELSVGWQARDETEAEGRRNCDPDRSPKSSPFVCLHPLHKAPVCRHLRRVRALAPPAYTILAVRRPDRICSLRSDRRITGLDPQSSGTMVTRSQHHHSRAHLHSAVEIDHILVGQPDATRRNRMSDPSRLVRAVDAIQRVLPTSVKV